MALGAMPLISGTPAAWPSCRTTSAAFAIPLTVAGARHPASSPALCLRRQRLWACAAPLDSIFDSAAAAEDRARSPRAGGARLSGMRVVVSGATGMVGRALLRALLADGVACVVVLARDERAAAARFAHNSAVRVLRYDAAASGPLEPLVAHAVGGAHAVVNLAGEPVDSGRWTDARKAVLWESRVAGSARLARAAERSESFRGPFVTASAVGFYGTSESTVFTEESESGGDFLAKLAAAWESAVWRYTRSSETVRTVVLRLGVVLGPDGGAVRKMSTAFRAFLGGVPGGGSQWFSWVHRDDVVEAIVQAISDPSWSGTYNCTSPNAVRLSKFCSELGRVLGRPTWLAVPAVAVKAALGSEAAQLILAGQHVKPERMLAHGFCFRFVNVGSALEDVLLPKDVTASAR